MKVREAIISNGRPAFYASIYDDLRNVAMDCGWALGLHGSIANDMDIMAMPWTENAVNQDELISELCKCLDGDVKATKYISTPKERTTYTIPIWADFYLDINIIK